MPKRYTKLDENASNFRVRETSRVRETCNDVLLFNVLRVKHMQEKQKGFIEKISQ